MKLVNIFTFHNKIYYTYYIPCKLDVHRTVHRNIISIVKPTRCIKVSNLFYFGMTLYMFRTVFPSIISSRMYVQQQALVKQILLSACQRVPASKQTVVHHVGFTIDITFLTVCCSMVQSIFLHTPYDFN